MGQKITPLLGDTIKRDHLPPNHGGVEIEDKVDPGGTTFQLPFGDGFKTYWRMDFDALMVYYWRIRQLRWTYTSSDAVANFDSVFDMYGVFHPGFVAVTTEKEIMAATYEGPGNVKIYWDAAAKSLWGGFEISPRSVFDIAPNPAYPDNPIAGYFTVDLPDIDDPMIPFYYVISDTGLQTMDEYSLSGDAFFPYNNSMTDTPVYDEETGEQLNDPFD